MSLIFRNVIFYLLVCVSGMVMWLPALAQQDTLQVLILNSYDESTQPYFRPTEEFKKHLQSRYSAPIAFQDIDLKQKGAGPQEYVDETIVQLLLKRYADSPPRLVVAIGPPAISFWVNNRDSSYPDALFLAMARESVLTNTPLRPRDAAVATRFSFTGVAENILKLRPETAHILMVFGDSTSERVLSAAAQRELESYSDRFSLSFTNDLAIHEIQERVALLPPDSAVFFGFLSSDINGVKPKHYSGLAVVRAASKAPVFGAFDDQMGQGIIGGRLIQATQVGYDLAEAALDLLAENSEQGSWRVVELSPPTYDWRELKTWGISLDRLPPDSVLLFEPAGFWELYGLWAFGAALIFIVQMWLLVTLLHQRRQRRKVEFAHATLGRRLITAHEDERRLIARELHDDLSQRLARASMDASFAHSHQGSDSANEVLKNLQPELVNISRDVHNMSYRLHPSLVGDLGLVAALHTEIERIQRRTDVSISANISKIQEPLPPETALCIYRIAQESLQNALKHAQADAIEVLFDQDSDGLMLSVRDNGIGFDVTNVRNSFSLGLSSMQERANLVKGKLNIRSRPGMGTTVSLSIPHGGAGA